MPTVLSCYGFWKDILANEKTFENVQKAKTVRDNVVDIDRIHRLHNKYKR